MRFGLPALPKVAVALVRPFRRRCHGGIIGPGHGLPGSSFASGRPNGNDGAPLQSLSEHLPADPPKVRHSHGVAWSMRPALQRFSPASVVPCLQGPAPLPLTSCCVASRDWDGARKQESRLRGFVHDTDPSRNLAVSPDPLLSFNPPGNLLLTPAAPSFDETVPPCACRRRPTRDESGALRGLFCVRICRRLAVSTSPPGIFDLLTFGCRDGPMRPRPDENPCGPSSRETPLGGSRERSRSIGSRPPGLPVWRWRLRDSICSLQLFEIMGSPRGDPTVPS